MKKVKSMIVLGSLLVLSGFEAHPHDRVTAHPCPDGVTGSVRRDGGDCSSGYGVFNTNNNFSPNTSASSSSGDNSASETGAGVEECAGGNPISIVSGNKYQSETDFLGVGPINLSVVRSYNSVSTEDGAFGKKWISNLTANLTAGISIQNVEYIDIRLPDGKKVRIAKFTDGYWYNQNGSPALLVEVGHQQGWLYQVDDISYVFDGNGRLNKLFDENGHYLEFDYDSSNRLIKVTKNSSANLRLFYSGSRVNRIIDPNGHNYYYYYDSSGNLSKVKYPDGNERIYHYQAGNRLTGITDENGHRFATWTYDGGGRANASWHGLGQQEKFSINSFTQSGSTKYRTTTNALGKQTKYTFTTIAGKARITNVEGVAKGSCLAANSSYTYDIKGYKDKVTDWQGHVTDYDHNPYGRITKITNGYGTSVAQTKTFEYWQDTSDKPTKITSPSMEKLYQYDNFGRITQYKEINTGTSSTSGNTRTWNYSYTTHANGVVKTRTTNGPRTDVNDLTIHEYDNKGNLVWVTNALGHITYFSNYDSLGRARQITEPNGRITQFVYNSRGWVTSRVVKHGSLSRSTTYTYTGSGLLKKVTHADGSSYDFAYDTAQRLIKVTDSNDTNRGYIYDKASNITIDKIYQITSELQVTTSCCTPWGDPIINTEWVNTETVNTENTSQYDALSRLTKIIGGNNQTTQYGYHKDNLLSWEKDGLGKATYYYYNALKQLTSTRDANNKYTYYYYTAEGNLRAVRDPDNRYTYYDRDGYGQVYRLRSPDTGYTHYQYDQAGNVKKETKANGLVTNYTYDALNRVKTVVSNGMSQAFTYDSIRKGHLYQVTNSSGYSRLWHNGFGELTRRYDNINGVGHNTYWYYDNMSRVNQIIYPDSRRVYYTYNNTGSIETVKTRYGSSGTLYNIAINAKYKPFGPIEEFTYGNGEKRLYERDLSYRLSGLGSGNFLANDYTFDANNNVKSINDVTSTNQDRAFNYDNLQRVSSHTGPDGSYSYTFDNNGNRKTSVRNGSTTTNYYTSGTNKLYRSGATNYTLDAAGNTKQIGSRVFTYNGENRLSRVVNGGTTVDYKYNAFGERVYKQKGSLKTYYIYGQNGQLLYEKEGSIKKSYIYFGEEIVAYVRNNAIYYVHSDHLGRPQIMTNSSKIRVWNAQTNAYGRTLIQGSSLGFNVGFPGQYWDADTNLFYNYFRDYDPSIGRYIQPDPLGLWDGTNIYNYVYGDPVNWVAPTGEYGVPGAVIGALVEVGVQKASGRENINWRDVAVSATVGAVAPSALASGTKAVKASKAKKNLNDQLKRAKAKSLRKKLNNRIKKNTNIIKEEALVQTIFQSMKQAGKTYNAQEACHKHE